MSGVAIVAGIAAFLIVGIMIYMLAPPAYDLYNTSQLANASADVRASAGYVNDMLNVSPLIIAGAIALSVIGITLRSRGNEFS